MVGIRFVTNEKGQKVAVQIDLKKLGELWIECLRLTPKGFAVLNFWMLYILQTW